MIKYRVLIDNNLIYTFTTDTQIIPGDLINIREKSIIVEVKSREVDLFESRSEVLLKCKQI